MRINWNNIQIPVNTKSTLTWSVDYASIVHEGTGANYPPRPWVDEARRHFQNEFNNYATNALNSADYKQAFYSITKDFGQLCQDKIKESIYPWPGETKRKSGDIVTSPRNIVDTKELYNSYSITHE
jgi:hypothetical protein